MNYKTVTETFSTLDDCSGQDFEYEVSLPFTPLGLTQYGTFILEDNPSSEEHDLIAQYKADWAVEYRFLDFKAQVNDWARFQVFIESIRESRQEDIEAAQLFLQAEDWDSPTIHAQDLQIFKTYKAWSDKHGLNCNVSQAPTTKKPAMKI